MLWPFSASARLQAARNVVERLAPSVQSRISVQLWDGSVLPLGPDADPDVRLVIHSPGVISSLLRWPTLDNFVRHYAAGRVEFAGTDLVTFAEMARGNGARAARNLGLFWALRQALPFLFLRGDHSTVSHAIVNEGDREPTRQNYKRVVQFHYDVGNEFYQLLLDPEMQYSCGYFRKWDNSLAQAQLDKMEMICRKLRLRKGETLLDVGCGWGGLLCHAARHHGVRGHGVTLSQRQLEFARAKVRRLGLEEHVTLELKDIHDLRGPYDKIASIGMMEHVGIANYPGYFRKLHSLLADGGVLLNQAITRGAKSDRRRFLRPRPEHRFIKKYIFPGGELDHIGHTLEVMEQQQFLVHDVEGWREHYALTCQAWCRNLTANRDKAEAIVGPEVVRMWLAYLAGFSICFRKGSLRLFQVVAAKKAARHSPLPPSREDLYARPFPSASRRREMEEFRAAPLPLSPPVA